MGFKGVYITRTCFRDVEESSLFLHKMFTGCFLFIDYVRKFCFYDN